MTLANKVQEFNEKIVPVAHQIVHGDAQTVVQTDGGPVRSLAKLIADNDAAVNAAGLLGAVNDAAAAAALAQALAGQDRASAEVAKAAAEAARDAAQLSAGIYPDAAAGLAAVAEGAYFSIVSNDAAGYIELYRKLAGAASLVFKYPSQPALQFVLDRIGTGTTDYPFTIQDALGRVLLGVDPSGKFAFNQLNFGGALFKQGGVLELLSILAKAVVSQGTSAEHGFMPINLQDELGRIVAGVDRNGGFHGLCYHLGSNAALSLGTRRDLPFFVEDALGRVPLALSQDGSFKYIGGTTPGTEPPAAAPAAVKAAINHIITYGQSLSIGGAAFPAISLAQPYNSLMFDGGVRTSYPQSARNSFTALVENNDADGSSGETPSAGTAQAINELLGGDAISLNNFQLLLSAPGMGGKNAWQLSKGREYYASLVQDITVAAQLASAQGKSFALQAVTYTQGENDEGNRTPRATWKQLVRAMHADITADCKAITGQKHAPVFIMYQMASYYECSGQTYPEIAMGQLELAEEGGGIYMATPMYIFDYINALHLTPQTSKLLGAYYGLVYHTVVIEGADWKPLMPVDFDVRGKTISVRFNAEKLVFDTVQVTAVAHQGFSALDASGNPLAIADVYIVGNDTIDIVLSDLPAAGTRLRYAIDNYTGNPGRTQGARGNVREAKSNTPTFDPAGMNFPLHRWLVMFDKTVN